MPQLIPSVEPSGGTQQIPAPLVRTIFEPDLSLADVTSLNGGTITQAADGTFTMTIPGGAIIKDPADIVLAAWRVKSVDNFAMGLVATQVLPGGLMAAYIEDTAAGLTTDSGVMVGFLDSATLAGANGCCWAAVFGGSGRSVVSSFITAGTTTLGVAPANFSMDRMLGNVNFSDDAQVFQSRALGFDGTWAGRTGVDAESGPVTMSGDLYFFIAGYRDLATAGTATVVFRAGYPPTYTLDLDDFG